MSIEVEFIRIYTTGNITKIKNILDKHDFTNEKYMRYIQGAFNYNCNFGYIDVVIYLIDYCEKRNKKIDISHVIQYLNTINDIDILKYILYLYFHNCNNTYYLLDMTQYYDTNIINGKKEIWYYYYAANKIKAIEKLVKLCADRQLRYIKCVYVKNNKYNNKFIINNNLETLTSCNKSYNFNYVIYCTSNTQIINNIKNIDTITQNIVIVEYYK